MLHREAMPREPSASGVAATSLKPVSSSATTGLSTAEANLRLVRDGANEVAQRRTHPLLGFAKKFWGISAWMIELIALLSFVLHKSADAWIAFSLLIVNAILGFLQERRASSAVEALRSKLQITARVLRDGTWRAVSARNLVVADVVRLRAGDFVPADVQLAAGTLRVDQSALTGESAEIDKAENTLVYAGSTVHDGEATGVVAATGARTFYGRTTQLVQTAHPKLHVEEVISRIVRWLVLIVGVLVAVTIAMALAQGNRLVDVLPVALVLLMSAIPVALPVMFTVSMAVGSMELGRRGVLITRLGAIEDAATMNVLCADKTGTLTMNRLSFTGAAPQPGFTENDIVRIGALASNAADADPLDIAFLRAATDRKLIDASAKTISFTPFSAQSRHTEATIEIAGKTVRVIKGALRTVAEAADLDASAIAALEASANEAAKKGVRVLAVAQADGDGPFRLCGLAMLYDEPRPESRALIDELRSLGVKVLMLTGDALAVANEIANVLGLGAITQATHLHAGDTRSTPIPDLTGGGLAEVFPEDKFVVVKSLQAARHVAGMTGDGVNDAPALRQAEVGIAVSGATDVVKGAASAVLTTDGLVNIVDLVKQGRATYQRVLTWIMNKISRTVLKAGFVVIAFVVTGKFVISALVMLLVVCLTDVAHIALATDRVHPSQQPETWNIGPLVKVAVVVGAMTLLETLGLLAFAWHRFDLANDAGRLQTFTFQTFLFFALTSLVSMRERRAFWKSRPSAALTVSLIAAAIVGIIIGHYGVAELAPLPMIESACIGGFAVVCALIPNDVVKTMLCARALRTTSARKRSAEQQRALRLQGSRSARQNNSPQYP